MSKLNKKKIESIQQKKEGELYRDKLKTIQLKEKYISNYVQGRFFLERCNMIAGQISSENILEKVDGCPKTKGYLLAEYNLTKRSAINSFRESNSAKQELEKKGVTEEELLESYNYYMNEPILREDYGDEHEIKTKGKAAFVKEK